MNAAKSAGLKNLNYDQVQTFLRSVPAYTLHKKRQKKFSRDRVLTVGPNDLACADLIDLQSLSQFNKGYRYILAVINAFTKEGYLEPLVDKTGSEVVLQMRKVLRKLKIRFLQTDKVR